MRPYENAPVLWPNTFKKLEELRTPWKDISKTEQRDILATFLQESDNPWQYMCDYDEMGNRIGKAIEESLDKADLLDGFVDYLLKALDDEFTDICNGIIEQKIETKKELAMLAQQEYEAKRRMAA